MHSLDSSVLAVATVEGLPSRTEVLAVTEQSYMVYGLSPVIVTASVVPLTTDITGIDMV